MKLFSPTCVLCEADATTGVSLCRDCLGDLPLIKHSCHRCGLPTEVDIADALCGQCQKQVPPIDYMVSSLEYAYPVGHLVSQLKFQHHLSHANILSHILLKTLKERLSDRAMPELIIPVPLHKKRLRERGFNQALELARPIAKHFSIPVAKSLVVRVKHTQAQSLLNAKLRHQNLKDSFEIIKPITEKHVVIIDDVVTTGTTVYELARLLKASGVATVGVWAVART